MIVRQISLTQEETRVLKIWAEKIGWMIGTDDSPTPDEKSEKVMWDIIKKIEALIP